MKLAALLAAVAAAAVLSACAPSALETDASPLAAAPAPMPGDIVTVASEAGQFNTLLQAATAAGIADTLKGEGPFTVFAPNDAAFAAPPAGTVEGLLKPENKDKLAGILTYHVAAGNVASTSLTGVSDVTTVNGATVKIDAASNGVIHVLDKVIMPLDKDAKKK
jgi:uncharacterized surface protein with fasciclin (FAS1) repeats